MDTDSFNIHIKTEYIYEYIADDGGKRFDTSNSEINRPLPTRENKKVIGLMKDELRANIERRNLLLFDQKFILT